MRCKRRGSVRHNAVSNGRDTNEDIAIPPCDYSSHVAICPNVSGN
jgi:hypothetical protein